jgi:hypothetical protein
MHKIERRIQPLLCKSKGKKGVTVKREHIFSTSMSKEQRIIQENKELYLQER